MKHGVLKIKFYLISIVKMKTLKMLLVLAIVGLGFAFTVQSDVEWINVSGYVDNSDGDVLSKVSVKCFLNSDQSLQSQTITDDEGFYSIQVRKSESCTLTFDRSGYDPHDETVSSSTNVVDLNVTMNQQSSN